MILPSDGIPNHPRSFRNGANVSERLGSFGLRVCDVNPPAVQGCREWIPSFRYERHGVVGSAGIRYPSIMNAIIKSAIPVLPAADTTESLNWWDEKCGFKETFRDATPPNYAGINRGGAHLHLAGMSDKELARKVGDQTMVRIAVQGIEAMYAEYQKRGGKVHPNGALQTKPWGTKEFAAIDPCGVCVTFQE
jgi:uncharacterized glyoxalase superfamily protein PhnB